MTITAEWMIKAQLVPLAEAAKLCGESQQALRQSYQAGMIGPQQADIADGSHFPLYNLAALLVLQEAKMRGVELERARANLPTLAGSAYIEFQLAEIRGGRWDQRGGTPALNNKLWAVLHSDRARTALESQLPHGPVSTKRFGGFAAETEVFWDTADELEGFAGDLRIVDSWAVAAVMKLKLRGRFFATFIP